MAPMAEADRPEPGGERESGVGPQPRAGRDGSTAVGSGAVVNGPADAGSVDSGSADAGSVDSGSADAGAADPGAAERAPEARAARAIEQTLREAELPWESSESGTYVVQLPGTRKLSTTCQLIVGRHTLSLNAFVVRHPDENHEAFYRWLLERNLKLYGVGYAIDRLGDVYLTGRLPLAAVTPDEVDRLLGAVVENADGSFNILLELGFASAIRKEYAWRVSRGEPTRNLDAFTHLTGRGGD